MQEANCLRITSLLDKQLPDGRTFGDVLRAKIPGGDISGSNESFFKFIGLEARISNYDREHNGIISNAGTNEEFINRVLENINDILKPQAVQTQKVEFSALKIGDTYDKARMSSNKIYLFEESLFGDRHRGEGLTTIPERLSKALDVFTQGITDPVELEQAIKKSLASDQNTSSVISTVWGTDNTGQPMRNAVGLPTRLYSHNGKEWARGKEGAFTEEDIDDIVNMYKTIALKVKAMLGQKTQDQKNYLYKGVVLPNRIGQYSNWTEKVANAVASVLKSTLGIAGKVIDITDPDTKETHYIVLFNTDEKAERQKKEKEDTDMLPVRWSHPREIFYLGNKIDLSSEEFKMFKDTVAILPKGTTINFKFKVRGEEKEYKYTVKNNTGETIYQIVTQIRKEKDNNKDLKEGITKDSYILKDSFFEDFYLPLWNAWASLPQNKEQIDRLRQHVKNLRDYEDPNSDVAMQPVIYDSRVQRTRALQNAKALAILLNGKDSNSMNNWERDVRGAILIRKWAAQNRPEGLPNDVNVDAYSIIQKAFPNLDERNAVRRIFLTFFSNTLSEYIDRAIKYSQKEENKDKLTNDRNVPRGFTHTDRVKMLSQLDRAEARLWALNHLTLDFLTPDELKEYKIQDVVAKRLDLASVLFTQLSRFIEFIANNIQKYADSTEFNYVRDYLLLDENGNIDKNNLFGSLLAKELKQKRITKGSRNNAWQSSVNARASIITSLFGRFANPEEGKLLLDAFKEDIAFDLSIQENVRIRFFKEPDQEQGEEEKAVSLKDEDPEALENDEQFENLNTVGGYDIINMKSQNIVRTLTARMKKLLSEMDNTDGRGRPVYDMLGNPMKLSPYQAFYILADEFSEMSDENDMDAILDRVSNTYSWAYRLKDLLYLKSNPNVDWDLRKEFYAIMRKAAIDFFMVTAKGNLKSLNKTANGEAILEMARTTVGSGNVLNYAVSLYNQNGDIDSQGRAVLLAYFGKNKDRIKGLSQNVGEKDQVKSTGKVKKDSSSITPIQYARSVLELVAQRYQKIENNTATSMWVDGLTPLKLVKALLILRGENKVVYKKGEKGERAVAVRGDNSKLADTSIVDLLNAIGIRTDNKDINTLLPDISAIINGTLQAFFGTSLEEIESTMKDTYQKAIAQGKEADDPEFHPTQVLQKALDLINSDLGDDDRIGAKQAFEETLINNNTMFQYKGLSLLLKNIAIIIGAEHTEGQYKWSKGDISNFKYNYMQIGNVLGVVNTSFTQTMFRLGETTRCSYVVPDFINIFEQNLHKPDEQARQYLIDRFGDADFYCDRFGEENIPQLFWLQTFLNGLVANRNDGTKALIPAETLRQMFHSINVLAIKGDKKKNMIGKVDKETLKMGAVIAYLQNAVVGKSNIKEKDYQDVGTGLYRNPLFADVPAAVFFKYIRFKGPNYKDNVINALTSLVIQEAKRIRDIEDNEDNENKVTVEFYNDKKGNGKKFNFFPEFQKDKNTRTKEGEQIMKLLREGNFDELKAYIKEQLSSILEVYARNFVNSFTDDQLSELFSIKSNIQQEGEEDKDDDDTDPSLQEERKNLTDEDEKKSIKESLVEFYYNDFLAQTQLIALFGGDIAQYKDFRDFIKRFKQAYTGGQRIYARDKEGNRIYEKAIYIEDLYETSSSWAVINKLLEGDMNASPMEKAMLRGAINAYHNICATDGQSFRTLASMRKIYEAMGGAWNSDLEESFNNIRAGRPTHRDIQIVWENLKPFVMSSEKIETYDNSKGRGRKDLIVTQHKNSEYALGVIYSVINIALNRSPELVALNKFMEENDIDVAHFHSVVKEGYFAWVQLNYDNVRLQKAIQDIKDDTARNKILEKKTSDEQYESYMKYIRKQLEEGVLTSDSYEKAVLAVKFERGTKQQLKDNPKAAEEASIRGQQAALQSLREQILETDPVTQEVRAKKNKIHTFPLSDYMLVQPKSNHLVDYEALIGSQMQNIVTADLSPDFTTTLEVGNQKIPMNRNESIKHFNRLLVDTKLDGFQEILKILSNNETLSDYLLSEMERNSAQYDQAMKEAVKLDEKGNFKIPLNNPITKNKINQLILNLFKKKIQKSYINGGTSILVSNFGLSDQLQTQWKDAHTGELLTHEQAEKRDRKDLAIAWIPAYLPYSSKAMFEKALVYNEEEGYYTLDINKFKSLFATEEEANKALEVIGYRIPTEDKYSIFSIRIMGFLPQEYGGAIMLPTDIITMSGTDFDIDKLFMMIRTIVYYGAGRKAAGGIIEYILEQQLGESDPNVQQVRNYMATLDAVAREDIQDVKQLLSDFIDDLQKKNVIDASTHDFIKDRLLKHIGRKMRESTLESLKNSDNPILSDMVVNFFNTDKAKGKDILDFTGKAEIDMPYTERNEDGTINLDKMSENATHDQRNNMLIDSIWSFLTSHEGSILSLIPGSFPTVILSSRINRITNDPRALAAARKKFKAANIPVPQGVKEEYLFYQWLQQIGTEDISVLDGIYEDYAAVQNPADIQYWLSNFKNLMDGNDLIGMLAVNSSAHYKFQFLKLKLKDNYVFKMVAYPGGPEIVMRDIDKVHSIITGLRIGRNNAEMQAASPDNGKNPCLGDMNVNSDNIARVELLLRLGFSIPDIGVINTTDDNLIKYAQDLRSNADNKQSRKTMKEITEAIDKTQDEFVLDMGRLFALKVEYITTKKLKNLDDQKYAVMFHEWRRRLDKAAEHLHMSSAVARSDSQNGALPADDAEVIQQRMMIEQFKEAMTDPDFDFAIEGLEEVVPFDAYVNLNDEDNWRKEARSIFMDSPIPRLAASYSLGIEWAGQLVERHIKSVSPTVIDMIKELRYYIRSGLLYKGDISTIKGFTQELISFLLTQAGLVGSSAEDIQHSYTYYIAAFPQVFKDLLNTKKYGPQLRKLDLINTLEILSGKPIRTTEIGKITQETRRKYSEELTSLIMSDDPVLQKLAIDLLKYTFHLTGLNYGHNNYNMFISPEFMIKTPGFIDSLQNVSIVMQRLNFKAELRDNYMCQFLINNSDLIPYISPSLARTLTIKRLENGAIQIMKESNGTFVPIEELKQAVNPKEKVEFRNLPFIKYAGDIYRLADITEMPTTAINNRTTDIPVYIKVCSVDNKRPKYYNAKMSYKDIEYDNLPKYGVAVNTGVEQEGNTPPGVYMGDDSESNVPNMVEKDDSQPEMPNTLSDNNDVPNTPNLKDQDVPYVPNLSDQSTPQMPQDVSDENSDVTPSMPDLSDGIPPSVLLGANTLDDRTPEDAPASAYAQEEEDQKEAERNAGSDNILVGDTDLDEKDNTPSPAQSADIANQIAAAMKLNDIEQIKDDKACGGVGN